MSKNIITETTCDTCGGKVNHPCSNLGRLTFVDGQGRTRFEADICENCQDEVIRKLWDNVPQGAAYTYGDFLLDTLPRRLERKA